MTKPSTSPGSQFLRFAFPLMVVYLIWTGFPLLWVLYSSLKTDRAIFESPFSLPSFDQGLQWTNYAKAFQQEGFQFYFINSFLVVSVSVFGILALGAMAGYALSRFHHKATPPLFWIFLAGLMIPVQIVVIPLFFQLRSLGLLNSLPGLCLVYVASGLPFAIFILSGFFRTLPKTLYEAAKLDGCSEFQIFFRVMLPLARPGLATVAIFQFIILWKEFFFAFMFLTGDPTGNQSTLALGLARMAINSQYKTDYGLLFAGLAIVIIPLIVIYVALQKQLVKGITSGAIKG